MDSLLNSDGLLGFEGRLNRAKMWIVLVANIGWFVVMGFVAFLGFDWKACGAALQAQSHPGMSPADIDWQAVLWPLLQSPLGTATLALLLLMLFIAEWVNVAVMTKRLHDRDKSVWWLIPYWLVPLVWAWLPRLLGLDGRTMPSLLPMIFFAGLAVGVLNIWVFIEMFCLRGTAGANRFGPDPLSMLRSYIG